MKHLTLLLICLYAFAVFGLDANTSAFTKGNKFYESKEYDSALVYYHAVLNNGVNNAALLYNTGNCYFRKNSIAKAILFYERALRLSPTDEDIKANLKFARLNIIDKIPENKNSMLSYVLKYLHNIFSLHTELILLFILLMFLTIFISLSLYLSGNKRLWLIYLSVIFFILTGLIASSTGYKIYTIETQKYAIVMTSSIEAKNAPDGEKTLFTAHAGTKFKVLKSEDEWFFVSLPNGVSGWIKRDTVELI